MSRKVSLRAHVLISRYWNSQIKNSETLCKYFIPIEPNFDEQVLAKS